MSLEARVAHLETLVAALERDLAQYSSPGEPLWPPFSLHCADCQRKPRWAKVASRPSPKADRPPVKVYVCADGCGQTPTKDA